MFTAAPRIADGEGGDGLERGRPPVGTAARRAAAKTPNRRDGSRLGTYLQQMRRRGQARERRAVPQIRRGYRESRRPDRLLGTLSPATSSVESVIETSH